MESESHKRNKTQKRVVDHFEILRPTQTFVTCISPSAFNGVEVGEEMEQSSLSLSPLSLSLSLSLYLLSL